MSVSLSGKVFHDLHLTAAYTSSYVGIPNICIGLQCPDSTFAFTTTNALGLYAFSNLNQVGLYTVFEGRENIPYTDCYNIDQPDGFNISTTFRFQTIFISQSMLDEQSSIDTLHFGHSYTEPFDFTTDAFQVDGLLRSVYTINVLTGKQTFLCSLKSVIHPTSLVYNQLDHLLYYYDSKSHNIGRISKNGSIHTFKPTSLPDKSFCNLSFDRQGNLYLYEPLDTSIYIVNLNPNVLECFSCTILTLSTPLNITTWVMHPKKLVLYALKDKDHIIQLDLNSLMSETLPIQGLPYSETYAMFFDFDGILYILSGDTSSLYQLILSEYPLESTLFSKDLALCSPFALTRCPLTPIEVHQGTAPKGYSTSSLSNGPRHLFTKLLSLVPPTSIPTLSLVDTNYHLPIQVHNHTNHPVYLYGWIDYNQNGIFEISESISPLTIPPTKEGAQTLILSFPLFEKNIILGRTYLRLRLTSDSLENRLGSYQEDTRSLGPASDGDILDLPIDIIAPPPVAKDELCISVLRGESTFGYSQVTDPSKGTLNYTLVALPNHGKASVDALSGKWVYTSLGTSASQDTFSICATSSVSKLSCTFSVAVTIEVADLSLNFTTSELETTCDDIITYTAKLRNTGTLALEKILFKSSLPPGVKFVNGSVTVNHINDYTSVPEFGINLEKLLPDSHVSISFQLQVTDSTLSNIENTCFVESHYMLTPQTPFLVLKTHSKPILTVLRHVDFKILLSSHLESAFIDDLIQYTLKIENLGDLNLSRIRLALALPEGMYYKGDFTLDYVLLNNSLLDGYTIPNLSPLTSCVIQFKAGIRSIPPLLPSQVMILAQYDYTLNNTVRTMSGLTTSCPLTIHSPNFKVLRYSDQKAVGIGETFSYTLTCTNESSLQVDEIILKEDIPDYLEVISITQSLQPLPHNTLSTGIALGTLDAHSTKSLCITVRLLNKQPPSNLLQYSSIGIFKIISNHHEKVFYIEPEDCKGVLLSAASLDVNLTSSIDEGVTGETLSYYISLTNTGTIPLTDLKIQDILSPELKFTMHSVQLDHVLLKDASIINGLTLDSLAVGATKNITFDACILARGTGVIQTNCSIHYTYIPYGSTKHKLGFMSSQTHNLHVLNPKLTLSGNVDQTIANLHDILCYTIEVTNTGDVDAFNVLLTNDLNSCKLLDGSFTINDQAINSVSLHAPIDIGFISKGMSTLIKYKVKVVGSLHHKDELINTVNAQFIYYTNKRSPNLSLTETIQINIPLTLSTFKQLCLENAIELPYDKPDLLEINTINGQAKLLKDYIIQTPKGISEDGQILTGYKLIIHATLEFSVEYISSQSDNCICTSQYSMPFSTFIILPADTPLNSKIHIKSTIQDISFKVINTRMFFMCSSLFIMGYIQ